MSRTRKRPYSKSKRTDKTCRNHGKCPRCRRGRLYNALRTAEAVRIEVELWQKETPPVVV